MAWKTHIEYIDVNGEERKTEFMFTRYDIAIAVISTIDPETLRRVEMKPFTED